MYVFFTTALRFKKRHTYRDIKISSTHSSHKLVTGKQDYISVKHNHFIRLLHSLGPHFSTHFKSFSGLFKKNTDPYYQLLKCIMECQTLTIFVLWHYRDVGFISSITWIEYTAYTFFLEYQLSYFIPIFLKYVKYITYEIVFNYLKLYKI